MQFTTASGNKFQTFTDLLLNSSPLSLTLKRLILKLWQLAVRMLAVSVKRHVCKRQGCLVTSDNQQGAWQEAAGRQLESGKEESVKTQATSSRHEGNDKLAMRQTTLMRQAVVTKQMTSWQCGKQHLSDRQQISFSNIEN